MYAQPPLNRQAEDRSKGTVIWKLQKSVYGPRSAPKSWQDHLENILTCGFTGTCWIRAWTHTEKRVTLAFHVDDLLLAGTRQAITEVIAELSRDLEMKSNEVTTKPTRYLGRTLVRTKEEYNIGVDVPYADSMLEEFNMSALTSSPTPRWERRGHITLQT